LRDAGHQPVIVMPEFYRPLIDALEFEFHAAGPAIDPNDHALIERVMDPVRGSEVLLRGILMPTLRADYEALDAVARGADAIVTHPITFAGPVIAQARRLPWVSTVLAPMSFFSATDPPVLAPAPFLAHFSRVGPWYGRAVAALVRRSTRSWLTPVFDLRREVGLPPGRHPLFEGQFSPTLTLALFSRVLAEPQATGRGTLPSPDLSFTTAQRRSRRISQSFSTLGRRLSSSPLEHQRWRRPGISTTRVWRRFAQLGVRAVLLTGGFEQNRPRDIPTNVRLVDRAPHQLLFPRAAAIVHQGGAGTLAQALRAGKPTLVVPHAHDQPDNAARVVRLGSRGWYCRGSIRGRASRTNSVGCFQKKRSQCGLLRSLSWCVARAEQRPRSSRLNTLVLISCPATRTAPGMFLNQGEGSMRKDTTIVLALALSALVATATFGQGGGGSEAAGARLPAAADRAAADVRQDLHLR
jgi:UDP:flavonoid glycosyltransferase YjiC (YdhE family)